MNNLKFLLLGTSLSCLPQLAYTQCVTVQDCTALGYTETSCPDNGVKCPFGNGWFCAEDENVVCAENGFKYSCTGTGYAGGAGSACGGKYTQCTCASGYEWKDGSCQQKILNGAQGNLYYCDGKAVGIKTSGINFYVAVENAGEEQVFTWTEANSISEKYFCGKGRLPTLDELKLIYNDKLAINSFSTAVGGQSLLNGFYWSSTYAGEVNNITNYYVLYMYNGNVGRDFYSDNDSFIRPVMAF